MLYPVSLDLEARAVLVVGGGRVALGKVRGLLGCGARVTVVAPDVSVEIVELGVTVVARAYRAGDIDGFALVFTATDDPVVNGIVSADAQAAGTWVNSADDPARCTFQLPAVIRRGPMTVAVSSSGRSPALARWVRDQIAGSLDPDLEWLAAQLAARRDELHAQGRTTEGLDWVAEIDTLLERRPT